jgi:hypothetical protein
MKAYESLGMIRSETSADGLDRHVEDRPTKPPPFLRVRRRLTHKDPRNNATAKTQRVHASGATSVVLTHG